ncbi:MAG: hypothetical protein HY867_09110 [Chloroflexi bacterium]|nr:hypothetical protein [Chloroflexota bacterium]
MFNDRDLGILGAGALLAVLSLFLPLSFAGKVVVGFLVLVAFMALALLRLGPDRVPPEVWLMRRFRYSMQARQYVNQQEASCAHSVQNTPPPPPSEKKSRLPKTERPAPSVSVPVTRPLDLAWNEIGVYPLLTAFLAVVGVYFAVWLAQGGAQELSIWFQ